MPLSRPRQACSFTHSVQERKKEGGSDAEERDIDLAHVYVREEGGRFRALGKALDLPCDVPVETIEVPAAFLKAASAAGAPAIEPRAPARVGSQIREPRKIQDVRPVYPASARKQRIQGVVVLECTISPKGKVAQTRVLRGVPELDDAAVDAVKQWIYAPTLLDGVPVPVIMTVTVTFKIS